MQHLIEKIIEITETLPDNVQVRVVDGLTITFTDSSVIFKRDMCDTPFYAITGTVPEDDRKQFLQVAKNNLTGLDFLRPISKLNSDTNLKNAFKKFTREGTGLIEPPKKKVGPYDNMPLPKLISDSTVISKLMLLPPPHAKIVGGGTAYDYFKIKISKARPSELAGIRLELIGYLHK